jgi:AbrB family looped-hinge helix DNA binding protein
MANLQNKPNLLFGPQPIPNEANAGKEMLSSSKETRKGMIHRTTLTSKGQITIPIDVRKRLGLRQGDQIEFDTSHGETVIRPVRKETNPFAKWRGAATSAFPGGMKEINHWIRDMRGPREDSE